MKRGDPLSPNEATVLKHRQDDGWKPTEIACRYRWSPKTVTEYLRRIRVKTGLDFRSDQYKHFSERTTSAAKRRLSVLTKPRN